MSSKSPVKMSYCAEKNSVVPNQVRLLLKAKKEYKEIPTFFGGFKLPIGIEIEIENFTTDHDIFPIYWRYEEDGSLKIKGMELISVPISGYNIDYALHEYQQMIRDRQCLWSHRTSIHVHAYVGNMTIERLNLLIALYAIYEPLFFSLVDEVRLGNPYCYPIRNVSPENSFIGNPDGKYCALNVGTGILNFNTVEFRHMHGNQDEKSIRRWIQLIVKLVRYVAGVNGIEKQIKQLNTVSNYDELTRSIFGRTADVFHHLDLKKEMEEGVLWAKVFLLGK